MTIKDWVQTYCRELSGSEPERELLTIIEELQAESYKAGYIANGIGDLIRTA